MAWDPDVSARAVAGDWVKMTYTDDPRFVTPVVEMMMNSRETVVDYMTPLGLAHQMAWSTHYGPGPWVSNASRPDWNSTYYSKVAADGIGFDRTATGSDAIAQYSPMVAARLADANTTPQSQLLWFHHLSWGYPMPTGRSLWDEMVVRYSRGVDEVGAMQAEWSRMQPFIDSQRFDETTTMLATQRIEAQWWRDGSIAYFETYSHRPTPQGYAEPAHPAAYYEAITSPFQP
jgi:alpha-glucuronidase